jgi:hypothetical protein
MSVQRRGQMRAIGAMLPKVAGAALGKNGIAEAQLLQHWAAIVGERLAQATCPEKLVFSQGERRDGTLRLSVAPGFAPEIQHGEPVLLDRINGFFGYRAVARLALQQTLSARHRAPPGPRPLQSGEAAALEDSVAAVGDEQIRAALRRLGAAIAGNERK